MVIDAEVVENTVCEVIEQPLTPEGKEKGVPAQVVPIPVRVSTVPELLTMAEIGELVKEANYYLLFLRDSGPLL